MNIKHLHIEQLIRKIVLPFYHVKRDMPLPIGERRWENDAEHSWSVAFLACALAPEIDKNLDVGKIAQYAIVHDIVEVYADDTSTFASEKDLSTKAVREAAAAQQISQEFSHFPWISELIEEYENKETPEAKFVYALDKYIAVAYDHIDEAKLFKERKMTLAAYNKSLASHREKAKAHPKISEYYEEVRKLLDARPDLFHAEPQEQ